MDVLHITTAGSVDDGKSTLIGRLLYETRSIPTDKLEGIERASKRKGIGFLDLSLLTDGLIAEREQGITIDVAHIYFSTPRRKFIIADTPGHVEYTRNMVTGASKADVSVILVDARHGILEQTHRHYFISNLLRIRNIIVCVNKMDLVDYREEVFKQIKKDFLGFSNKIKFTGQEITFVPVSALHGENITKPSSKMNWYFGAPLLEILENLDNHKALVEKPSRFPVQYVIRPRNKEHHDYRGYAGRISSGYFKVGDEIVVWPSGRESVITEIHRNEENIPRAEAKQSVSLSLRDDIDISRGDLIAKKQDVPSSRSEFNATLCWLSQGASDSGKTFLLQHGTRTTRSKIAGIEYVQHATTLAKAPASQLLMNDIARVSLRTSHALPIDRYDENPANGSFILVDEHANNTVAVGFFD